MDTTTIELQQSPINQWKDLTSGGGGCTHESYLAESGDKVESWQEVAAKSSIFFAQVREDPLLDQEVLDRYFSQDAQINMAMISSGGDTAAYILKDARLKKLDLVDISTPQLSLTRLKIELLKETTQRRLELLGHAPLDAAERRQAVELILSRLPGVTISDFEGNDLGAGIDRTGRYEQLFHALKVRLADVSGKVEALFALTSVEEQARFIAPDTEFGRELDAAFDDILHVDNYFTVFGERATSNKGRDFSKRFLQKLRNFLANHLASSSPFVSQILRADFYRGRYYDWYRNPQLGAAGPAAELAFHKQGMEEYLINARGLDVVHLSNITDWFTPEESLRVLRLAYQALRPNGVVFVRQINTHFDLNSVHIGFVWDQSTSEELIRNDRSFFYKIALVGRKVVEPSP
ncbi:hypothetical protein SAMD00019534_062440 [Acytostelium subglobosum LB1]|uniref:hypothetical protein n=1 Tax=Acytostelium subglobosum LB1 TaxID=1410327 RepID=UPI0006449AC1|nr:hypothetical protein SAMD00019534_062440 [Acytostelium subglobosum LB1]GAM23069.1 hypothetical protein SAMD00019534_062440 [Acytostelium subglobosum LB1]|eukprot:XP_012754296.1 hypothetical protein SAMD00019534_062440 [Acytostelium subglobosum LB1]